MKESTQKLILVCFIILIALGSCRFTYKINDTRNPNAPEWTKYFK